MRKLINMREAGELDAKGNPSIAAMREAADVLEALHRTGANPDKPCPTPGGHAGAFAAATAGLHDDPENGEFPSNVLAEYLGFESSDMLYPADEFQNWAEDNPAIWGNHFGGVMFRDGMAFGDGDIDLLTVAEHYRGVADRLEQSLG